MTDDAKQIGGDTSSLQEKFTYHCIIPYNISPESG